MLKLYKSNISTILLFWLNTFICFSQNQDSIKFRSNSQQQKETFNNEAIKNDTLFIKRLLAESIELAKDKKYNEAYEITEKAKNYCEITIGSSQTLASIYTYMGNYKYYMGELEIAKDCFKKSLYILSKINEKSNQWIALCYSNIALMFNEMGVYDSALVNQKQALDIYIQIFGSQNNSVISSLNSIGNIYHGLGDLDQALLYYNKACKIIEKVTGNESSQYAKTITNLGNIYQSKGDYNRAFQIYEKSLEILNLKKDSISRTEYLLWTKNNYNNIGTLFHSLSESNKAISYYQKALSLSRGLFGESHPKNLQHYVNIGNAYNQLGQPKEALNYFLLALESVDSNDYSSLNTIHSNIGTAYKSLKDYEQSLNYYFKALKLIRENGLDENAYVYHGIGVTYSEMEEYKMAIDYFKEAHRIWSSKLGEGHPNVLATNNDIGMDYFYMNIYSTAINYFQKTLNANEEYKERSNMFYTIEYLIQASWNIGLTNKELYQDLKDIKLLLKSYKYFIKAQNLITQRYTNLSKSGKLNYASNVSEFFANALFTNLLLFELTDSVHYLIEGFEFTEQSKSLLLYEAMQESIALHAAGIPDSVLRNEYDLRVNIAYYDKRQQELLNKGLSLADTSVLNISTKLFELYQKYENLKKYIETNYPNYYQAKYNFSTVDVNYVKKNLLSENQSLLEYLVGDSSIFLFLVRSDTFEVHEVKNDFGLDSLMQQMTKEGIYGYYAAPKSEQSRKLLERTIGNYTEAASLLYAKLIAPVEDRLKEKVIVVPDGVLGYLPFEALLSEQPERMADFKNYPFLLKKHQVSYCYSATLLKEMRDKQHRNPPTGELFAVAPFYLADVDSLVVYVDTTDILDFTTRRDSLGKLEGSGKEVASIHKTWGGMALYGQDASLAEFQKNASDYRILHLSTHGKADDRVGDYSYLAFSMPNEKGAFEKLYARDLYNYSLNADMVVLSACETGIGKLQRGEGIISLARAFAYAGAKSIFTTLWQVNDEKMKELMVAFYRYLKKGKEKDEALRLAKLDFLKKHEKELLGGHPFFWAGMIGIGDMGVMTSD